MPRIKTTHFDVCWRILNDDPFKRSLRQGDYDYAHARMLEHLRHMTAADLREEAKEREGDTDA